MGDAAGFGGDVNARDGDHGRNGKRKEMSWHHDWFSPGLKTRPTRTFRPPAPAPRPPHRGPRTTAHAPRITGYTTGIAFLGHSVGESNEDLRALIASAEQFMGPGFLVPIRNAELFRWCLERGLRVVQLMTLMRVGFYQEPSGSWMPSILY